MVPTSSSAHAIPTLRPPPSFADFKFTVIGQPQLLKRLTTPTSDFRASPTPAHMDLRYPTRAATPASHSSPSSPSSPSSSSPPYRPSLLPRLESADNTTSPFFQDMFIPYNPAEQIVVDPHPVIQSVTSQTFSHGEPGRSAGSSENGRFPHTTSPQALLVTDRHTDTISNAAPSETPINATSRATAVVQHEPPTLTLSSPPARPTTPLPLSTLRNEVKLTSSQQVLQIQCSLALSYESALLAFEKAKHNLALAQESYEAAKAAFAAAAKARTHFNAAVAPAHDEKELRVGEWHTAAADLEGINRTAVSNCSTAADHECVSQPSTSTALTAALTRSLNRRVIELEREADDARLAWSLESVERLPSAGPQGPVRQADVPAGFAKEDEALKLESRPSIAHDGVRASQGASASQAPTQASARRTPLPFNPPVDLDIPQEQSRTQDHALSSPSSTLQTTTSQAPSRPISQVRPLSTSANMSGLDRSSPEEIEQEESQAGHTVPIPTAPTHPSNAPQSSSARAASCAGTRIADTSRVHTLSRGDAPQDELSSGSALPSTPSESMVDELLDDNDDYDSHVNTDARNLKLENDSDTKPGAFVKVETKPLHCRGEGLWSVKKDEDDEDWKAGLQREGSVSPSLQVSRRSSVGPVVKGTMVGEDSRVSSTPSGGHSTCSTPFRHMVVSEPPLAGTQKAFADQTSSSHTVHDTSGGALSTSVLKDTPECLEKNEGVGQLDANDEVGPARSEKSFANPTLRSHEPASGDPPPPQCNIQQARDAPLPSSGTLLQRLELPLEEQPRPTTTTSEAHPAPLQMPSAVVLGKRRHTDDYPATPINPSAPLPKRRIFTKPQSPASGNQDHRTTAVEPRIGPADHNAYRNAEVYNRPPSAPRRMHHGYDKGHTHAPHTYDRYVPKNGWWHGGGRSLSPSDRSQKHGDEVRLGAHRLVTVRHCNSYRPGDSDPPRDRGGPPPRWADKRLVQVAESRGHGGKSLADRLCDP